MKIFATTVRASVWATTLFLGTILTHASLVFSNRMEPEGFGYTSHLGNAPGQGYVIFDHFELTAGAEINLLSWYGQFSDGLAGNATAQGNFDVYLFRDNPNPAPGSFLNLAGQPVDSIPSMQSIFALKNQSVTGVISGFTDPVQGGDVKLWRLDFSAFSLDAGNYWISICASEAVPDYFLWQSGTGGGTGLRFGGAIVNDSASDIRAYRSIASEDSRAFALQYLVPEETNTLALLAPLIAIGLVIRSRRR